MWYLLLILTSGSGMTSQQFPIGPKAECEKKMKVFDNTELQYSVPGRQETSPIIRAICIEGR